jgi:integrase
LVADGRNPITERRSAQASQITFGNFADSLIEEIGPGFSNAKHRAQWRMTLTVYAAALRDISLDAITTQDVLQVLRPLWTTRSETASRLRGRIERVLDAAKARGLRDGDNPARWRGHLVTLLPKRQKLARGHHAAMPYRDVPRFLHRLRASESVSGLALEFLILSASRTGEVLGAEWSEIDRDARIWTVPGHRMKAGREHRVPLSERMTEVLTEIEEVRAGRFVFPGQKADRPLSIMALTMVLRRMKLSDVTVHGFRSSFRDWVSEETDFSREVAESALAHIVGDATERAYRRGDALEQRRKLMQAWANYCTVNIAETD